MRIAFVMDGIATEKPRATTFVLAHCAHSRGHAVYLFEVADLTCFPDGHVGGEARTPPPEGIPTPAAFRQAVLGADAPRVRVTTAELDVLWLRQNPSQWRPDERWTPLTGILFGQIAVQRGVLVLDHPDTLAYAESKLYLQQFPEAVRPPTLITRSAAEVRRFHRACGRHVVLKPLDGYGGADVYLVGEDATNLETIVQSLARQGFIIAQEYLPAAREGDTRLFMMNGEPLVSEGKYAAIRRVSPRGDFRSNMALGGVAVKAEVVDDVLAVAGLVGPKLKEDGIFFAGIDIIGGKVVEINTISPGGLDSARRLERVDFGAEVIRAVERKLEHRRRAGAAPGNKELATLA